MRAVWPLKIVIIGATSVIAQECARIWAMGGPTSITLVGRDAVRTGAIVQELRGLAPQCQVDLVTADFGDPATIRQVADAACRGRPPDAVLIAHGARPDQRQCELDLDAGRDALLVNGVSPALFAEAFAGHLEKARAGTLIIIGSVTGDRGRKGNYVYGAAKGMLERYAEGLAHRLARTGVRVVLIKPGPTDTPQTMHLKGTGKRLARPRQVAQGIVDAAKGGAGVVYLPFRWRLIMLAIRHMPAFVFNRLNI